MNKDIEAIVTQWLNSQDLGTYIDADRNEVSVEAFSEIPADRPDAFVVVERVGGGLANMVIDHPSIALQFWHTTRASAAALAYSVDEVMLGIVGNHNISRVSRNSLYNWTDLDSNTPRYQAIYDLVFVP